MPAILRPWPLKSQMKGTKKRPGKKVPEGHIKYAVWAKDSYAKFLDDRPDTVAVDTETSGVGWFDEAFCVTMSWRRRNGSIHNAYFELCDIEALNCCVYILDHLVENGGELVFHHAKFDLQKLILPNILQRDLLDWRRIHDTEAQAHLLDEHQIKKLKVLARKYLGASTSEEATLKRVRSIHGIKVEEGYEPLPRLVVIPYALKDTEFTLRLHELFYPKVLAAGDGLPEKYEQEQELTLVLLDMEAAGLLARKDYLERMRREYGDQILRLEHEIADEVGKPLGKNPKAGEFNPNAPGQVLEVFWERGHAITNADKAALKETRDPLADKILELRHLVKMRNTYFDGALREARPHDAVKRDDLTFELEIHPNFRQHGTKTGRMSSGEAEG